MNMVLLQINNNTTKDLNTGKSNILLVHIR